MEPFGPIALGTVRLDAGEHKLTLRPVGKEDASKGYYLGVDRIDLVPLANDAGPSRPAGEPGPHVDAPAPATQSRQDPAVPTAGDATGEAALRQQAAKANGLQVDFLDGATMLGEYRVGDRFRVQDHWALSMELWIPGKRQDPQVIFLWGDDRRLLDVVYVCLQGRSLSASITDCRTNKSHTLRHDLREESFGRWLKFSFRYNPSTSKVQLLIDDKMVKKEPCVVTPAWDRPMPILVGGAGSTFGEKFNGRIRSLWFGNTDAARQDSGTSRPLLNRVRVLLEDEARGPLGPDLLLEPLVVEHMAMLGYSRDHAPSARVVRRLASRLAPATFRLWSAVCESDSSGRPPRPKGNPVAAWVAVADQLALHDDKPQPLLLGRHLIPLGYPPGVGMGAILRSAFEAQLDGEIRSVAEGLEWVQIHHPYSTPPGNPG